MNSRVVSTFLQRYTSITLMRTSGFAPTQQISERYAVTPNILSGLISKIHNRCQEVINAQGKKKTIYQNQYNGSIAIVWMPSH